jgi:hypothetical protein
VSAVTGTTCGSPLAAGNFVRTGSGGVRVKALKNPGA